MCTYFAEPSSSPGGRAFGLNYFPIITVLLFSYSYHLQGFHCSEKGTILNLDRLYVWSGQTFKKEFYTIAYVSKQLGTLNKLQIYIDIYMHFLHIYLMN